MHDELNRVAKKPKYQEIDCDEKSPTEQSEIWFNYFRARDDSIITDLFEGQIMSKIECRKCGKKSLSFDTFMDLSVSIPRKAVRMTGYVTVEECLQSYVQEESMEACDYRCSNKNCRSDNVVKDITLFRFPKILVIHLKRFYNSTMRREKLSTMVKIPEQINMTPFAPHSSHPSKKLAKNYKLYGMSHHSGSLNGGHYIGEVMNLDTNTWYDCNDSRCSKISMPDTQSASAYVLFYI